MISLTERPEGSWKPPIVLTVASKGEGIDDVAQAITDHFAYLQESGELNKRRLTRVRREIEAIALVEVQRKFGDLSGDSRLDALAESVMAGKDDPFSAADVLIDSI